MVLARGRVGGLEGCTPLVQAPIGGFPKNRFTVLAQLRKYKSPDAPSIGEGSAVSNVLEY